MPIYGKSLTPPPWVLEKNLNKQKITKLKVIFNRIARNDSTGVYMTLVGNEDFKDPYIYTFDAAKYPGTLDNYSYNLEALINKANMELQKDKMFGKDYRFDIMGNWSFGNIIIMKRSDMLAADYKKQIERYDKDVRKKVKKITKLL